MHYDVCVYTYFFYNTTTTTNNNNNNNNNKIGQKWIHAKIKYRNILNIEHSMQQQH